MTSEKSAYVRGILMISLTTLLWGILPLVLKMGLQEFSAGTIVWFRFAFAFLLLFILLSFVRSKPAQILLRPPWLGVLGGAALSANYFGMTQAIDFSGPSNVAILIQIAPVMLILVGILKFRERLSKVQVCGMVLAATGLCLFYRDRYGNAVDVELFHSANIILLLAAMSWVAYMICQKILSARFEAQSLNLLVYGTAAILFLPLVEWAEFARAGSIGWAIILFLGLNTLLAYGALAEAVKCIPLSLISIIITTNPLITLLAMREFPRHSSGWLQPEIVSSSGYLGAVTAVCGVILVVAYQHREAKS